jgi:hypothetical protein
VSVSKPLATYQNVLDKWYQLQSVELQSYELWAQDYSH